MSLCAEAMIRTVKTQPFNDQNPGTSGLRKKLTRFQLEHYAENFIQSIFDCVARQGAWLVVGGDGRLFNREICQKVLKMAAANGFGGVIIGRNGLLSTPAVSNLVRQYQADGGIILSASHNPGGITGDFGIKYNIGNGGPAPEAITEEIFARSQIIDHYKIVDCADIDLDRCGQHSLEGMAIKVIDPVAAYADLMEELFDFDQIRNCVKQGLSLCFDAMHAITGPYAQEIFVHRLGFAAESIVNHIPKEDFGGGHPDPNPVNARPLYDLMMSKQAPDLGAASDGDGDRNLIIGRGIFVSPSDSLAIMAANAHHVKSLRPGIVGVARSMPTSRAVDKVASRHLFDVFETPTGWKFFANLLDKGKITLCGEESFGTGSTHLREKDGIWAVLFWLNIISSTGKSVREIVTSHWHEFGRHYYSRHDYEAVDSDRAHAMMQALEHRLDGLVGMTINDLSVEHADNFTYHDPIDASVSSRQGIRILFKGGSRLIFRLSGTGTQGATVRLYLERYESNPANHHLDVQMALSELVTVAEELSGLSAHLQRPFPSLIT